MHLTNTAINSMPFLRFSPIDVGHSNNSNQNRQQKVHCWNALYIAHALLPATLAAQHSVYNFVRVLKCLRMKSK
jgi:hypothetical protein